MVRFTDITKIEDRKRKSSNDKGEDEGLWLSEAPILEAEEKKVSTGTSDSTQSDITRLEDIKALYDKFIKRAIEIKDRVKNDQGISPSPILSDLHNIIDNDLMDQLYEYAMSTPGHYEDMLIHTIDVTFVSIRVGKGLGYDIKMLLKLGLTAFLENVGMYRIPDRILKKEGKLTEVEIETIKKHPEIGAEILGQMGEKYRWLAEAALQIHERSDGSGYPKGLEGEEISELASIIGLIDTYVAMIKKRPYRERFIQTDAIKSILQASKGLFPSGILKAFLNQISLFPVNTYVKLNNKSIGRVISTEINQPLRPTVEFLYDSQRKKMKKRNVVRLSDNPLLYIVESINEDELP